jgi:hypothetical protein
MGIEKRKGNRGRLKLIGDKTFCRYCKKENHFIEDIWKLQKNVKGIVCFNLKISLMVIVRPLMLPMIILIVNA